MEFKKNSLIKIIKEVNSMDVEEMARRQMKDPVIGKYTIDKKTGELNIPKMVSGWHPDNPTPRGKVGIPDFWIANPEQIAGQERIIVPLGCDELNEFLEKHSDWLQQLRTQYNLEPQVEACERSTGEWPVLDYLGHKYQSSGDRTSTQERLKRRLHPLIKSFFSNDETNKDLEIRSIPKIFVDEKFTDNYTELSNESIEWGTHSFDFYKNIDDFKDLILKRTMYKSGKLDDLPTNMESLHLARQFNKIYRNWVETKKNQKEYEGKTPVYFLDKFGLHSDNLDVAIRQDFRISGTLNNNNTYNWNVNLGIKFGKKLEQEFTIGGGLVKDYTLSCDKTVNFELDKPYTKFDYDYTVLDNPQIKQGLIECFYDIKNQIMAIKPSSMLPKAVKGRLELRENKVDKLFDRIIKKLK